MSSVLESFDGEAVKLAGGEAIPADFVLVGIGVHPRTAIADSAGLSVDNGVLVDSRMQTSDPDIYAAGDIAAYSDPFSGERARVEHWVVAERQGEIAAANMLGESQAFDSAPFFWTEQFGVTIRYVGRAAGWDAATCESDFASSSLVARYFKNGQHCATATVGRDKENLEDELALEAGAQAPA